MRRRRHGAGQVDAHQAFRPMKNRHRGVRHSRKMGDFRPPVKIAWCLCHEVIERRGVHPPPDVSAWSGRFCSAAANSAGSSYRQAHVMLLTIHLVDMMNVGSSNDGGKVVREGYEMKIRPLLYGRSYSVAWQPPLVHPGIFPGTLVITSPLFRWEKPASQKDALIPHLRRQRRPPPERPA